MAASTTCDEVQHDVRELRLHGDQGGLTGVDAGHVLEKDPRLSFLAPVPHVYTKWPPAAGSWQDASVVPACTICTSVSSEPRSMLKATVNVVRVALQLSLFEQCCSWRAPFPAIGSVRVDPVEHPGAQPLDLARAPLHAPSPFCPPLVQHVEEPVAGDRVDLDLAALRTAAAGLAFKECSGWGGPSGAVQGVLM